MKLRELKREIVSKRQKEKKKKRRKKKIEAGQIRQADKQS